MSYTSKMANLPGIHMIDVDEVIRKGDPEAFPALSVHQPHGVFSKGMFAETDDEFEEAHPGLIGTELGFRIPFGAGASESPFPKEYLIDPSNYEAAIKELETAGSDIMARSLMGTNGKEFLCKDQNGTNFC